MQFMIAPSDVKSKKSAKVNLIDVDKILDELKRSILVLYKQNNDSDNSTKRSVDLLTEIEEKMLEQ